MVNKRNNVARGWTWFASTALALCMAGCGNSKPSANGSDGGTGGTGGAGGSGAMDAGTRNDAGGDSGSNDGTVGLPQKLVILHTNDIHSHFMGEGPEADYSPDSVGDDLTVGGLARLATAIGSAKATAAEDGKGLLLLDAGDFMMGTLFELLAQAQAPELQFMQAMGYDATTIGNHELDWTPDGLAGILDAAVTANVTVPILSSNMNFSDTSTGDDALQTFFPSDNSGIIKSKLVKTVGNLKIGLFGLIGKDAVQVTPQSAPLTFDAIDTAATRMVTELREIDKVDLVIALSHSGIDSTGKGEDADLASKVPGIDIIISGHTHDTLTDPVTVGNTLIVTAGAYGRYLGNLQLSVTPAAKPGGMATVTIDAYKLETMNDDIPGDATTQAQVDALIGGVDMALAASKLAYKKVVARTDNDLTLPMYAEAPVGNLVTDAYRAIGGALQSADPPAIAVEGNGQLRAPIIKGTTGNIWFADLFRVTPIGIGPDKVPGYPLVTFYLNAKDIASGLELGAAPELVPDQYFLQLSGLKVQYDTSKPPFGRVSSLTLVTAGGDVPLTLGDTTKCYKVIATSYVAGLLGVVQSFTQGALSVVAKNSDCATIVDPTTRFVDADPTTAEVEEIKQWQAVVKYVGGLPPDATGVPTIPAPYMAAQGRITKK